MCMGVLGFRGMGVRVGVFVRGIRCGVYGGMNYLSVALFFIHGFLFDGIGFCFEC